MQVHSADNEIRKGRRKRRGPCRTVCVVKEMVRGRAVTQYYPQDYLSNPSPQLHRFPLLDMSVEWQHLPIEPTGPGGTAIVLVPSFFVDIIDLVLSFWHWLPTLIGISCFSLV